VKSTWFKPGRSHAPGDVAGALAFITWRVAQNMLKSMRRADFDIDPGPQYFDFLAEAVVFAIQVAWRLVHPRYDDDGRVAFMTALANRTGEELAENRSRLLGDRDAAAIKADFIDLLNRRNAEYAEFGYGAEGPDFAFLRYFATTVAELMPEKDKRWTWDQVMAIEGPEAAATVARSVAGLFDEAPRRPRRASVSEG
jgi:anaerobic selenocysteine-containing dehydrogenase